MNRVNVPQLRFKGFEGEWKNKTLFDISKEVSYGMNAAAKAFDGTHKYIRITDIDSDSRKFIPNPLTSPEGHIDEKFKLKDNDLLFTRTGASVGKSYLYDSKDGALYYAGFLIKFNIAKANSYFVYSLTLKESYDKWVQVNSMRSGQPGLNAEEYKAFEICLPAIPEQQKIAFFLSAVDEKIQHLSRKKELLKQYKKGVMQQLFSGKLRFKNENGNDYADWEEKKLGDVAKFLKGKGISKSEISEDGINECIRYGELYTRYKEIIQDVFSKTNFDIKKAVVSQANDIIIPASGETQIDIATASCVMKSGVILGGDLNIIRTKNNGVFLSYYLNSVRKLDIANLAQGNSVVHLYSSQLALLNLNLPSLPEQQKIAKFLSSIDTKIESTNHQINQTQSFKKGLLQQMFV